MRGRKKKR